MKVSPGLKVSDCGKEVGRFVRIRVEPSRPWNAFSAFMAAQAVHSRALQKGQLPKWKDVKRRPRCDCMASLQLRDRQAGREEIGINRRHSLDVGKGVHWKSVINPLANFVPPWIKTMVMRNLHVRILQLFLGFFFFWLHTLMDYTDRSLPALRRVLTFMHTCDWDIRTMTVPWRKSHVRVRFSFMYC